jgi:glyoxylase-like metal-dependent hydrolase (beta-lactamase superfamily II)
MTESISEIHSGLFQISLPLPIRPIHVQVYLFHRGRESVLIDTGFGTEESLDALHEALRDIGCRPSDIAVLICTHYHPDHYGASAKIKQSTGCDVVLPKADSAYLLRALLKVNSDEYKHFLRSHGFPLPEDGLSPPALRIMRDCYLPAVPDRYINDGDRVIVGNLRLNAIWTPGHTPGHVVLYWREAGILLTGDQLLPHITPHVGIHTGIEGDPLTDYLASLMRLEELEVQQVAPAHGPCFTDHRGRIHEIFRHHDERQQAILNALSVGPMTAYELALSLFDPSLPTFHKELAAYEILAHLKLMSKTGAVLTHTNNGVVRHSVCTSG